MEIKFTDKEYKEAIEVLNLSEYQVQMLKLNFNAPAHTITATEMANGMHYKNYNAANLHYGRLGLILGKQLGWYPLPEMKVNVLVEFEKRNGEWHWIMRPELAEALISLEYFKDRIEIYDDMQYIPSLLHEGTQKESTVNRYVRSQTARNKCIKHYGYKCFICGIVLEDVYGETAREFIHVHHIQQISEVGIEHEVKPIRDLRPICPNCHAIIHRKSPAFTIEEVMQMIERTKKNNKEGIK